MVYEELKKACSSFNAWSSHSTQADQALLSSLQISLIGAASKLAATATTYPLQARRLCPGLPCCHEIREEASRRPAVAPSMLTVMVIACVLSASRFTCLLAAGGVHGLTPCGCLRAKVCLDGCTSCYRAYTSLWKLPRICCMLCGSLCSRPDAPRQP